MLTTKYVQSLPAKDKLYEEKDGGVRGLRVRVTPNGTKSLVLSYEFSGKQRCVVLGRFGDLSLAEARSKAEEIRAKARDGIDPKGPSKTRGAKDFRLDNVWFGVQNYPLMGVIGVQF